MLNDKSPPICRIKTKKIVIHQNLTPSQSQALQ